MHPASSIIVFTTLTGAGYGLLFWLGLLGAAQRLPADRGFAIGSLLLAVVAVSAGLASSAFHLGRPERAWRAFSQWRSSWLSREGVASVVTYVPLVLFAWAWILHGGARGPWVAAPLATAGASAATVVCTAYIYRSLKPIAHWSNGWVPANYLALAAMSGALWLGALLAAFGLPVRGTLWLDAGLIVLAAALKLLYWRHIDRSPGEATAESATGLGAFGRVRLFEAPHTQENFLLKEMGFAIARKHRDKLRRIAVQLAFVIPLLLTLIALATGGALHAAAAVAAAPIVTLGVLLERWLFFAEARHTVTLYYGASRA